VTAAAFLGSIGDPRGYDNSAQILRAAGLSLIEHPSGILRGTKRISKRGRLLLRQSAYIFAVRRIAQDGLFRAEYDALCVRNGGQKMKAVVAVMRSELRLMYSVARDRRMFTPEVLDWRARPARAVMAGRPMADLDTVISVAMTVFRQHRVGTNFAAAADQTSEDVVQELIDAKGWRAE